MAVTSTIDLKTLITQEAIAQGIDPAIALGVAQTESGISQWTPNGGVVTSSAGALGVFQLMPATAAGLGVDPTDLNDNIAGGISYLKQLYQKFGNWTDALAAYNWGPGNVNSGAAVPTSVGQYVTNVLNAAGSFAAGLVGAGSSPVPAPGAPDLSTSDVTAGITSLSPAVVAVGVIAAAAGLAFILRRS